MFLGMKVKDLMFPQLKDKNRKTNLAFAVDILEHVSTLNVIINGKSVLVYESCTAIQAFQTKLFLFTEQITENKLTHFPTLQGNVWLLVQPISTETFLAKYMHEGF
jgi:hypothetical protein